MLRSIGPVAFLALLTAGCGGGGGSDPATYTVGGTVTGLSGSGLVLQNSGGNDQPISASGSFTFSTPLPSGTSYSITVKSSPSSPAQGCLIANGTGTVTSANITNVSVSCQDGFTVSGTVSGLAGSGLGLATCAPGGPREAVITCTYRSPVAADGTFSFDAVFPPSYQGWVAITHQPTSPTQHCAINSADVPASTGTGFTVACTGYAYVTNSADNTLSAYSVGPATGALKSLGSPVATGSSPFATVGVEFNESKIIHNITHDDFRYVYVVNQGSNDVSGFAVDSSTGALSAITSSTFPGSPWAVGTGPQAMAAFVPAQALYIANTGSDDLTVFGIDPGSGALNSPSTYPTGKGPTSLAIHPSGFLYIANHGGSNDISGYELNSMSPLPGSPFPAGGNPLSLAIGAGGKFLYSANPNTRHARNTPSTLSGFSIDPSTGTLSPLSGSPFAILVQNYIATDHTGAYLYVTSGDGIVGYAIDQNTGALTALAGFPVATNVPFDAYAISIDSTNQFLYVTNDPDATVKGFRLDASTGALTAMAAPFPAGNGPQFIATF
jgi:6-phosphogluconolactonase (cycloisomerase 2 family)